MKTTFRLPAPVFSLAVAAAIIGMGSADAAGGWPRHEGKVIVPTGPILLFNGKDLTNFYTWLGKYNREDPNKVFKVVDQIDGAPAIRISGEDMGGLITNHAYANYHLVAEFRWGLLQWLPHKDRPLDSGILVHNQGPEGNYQPDYNSPWMHSIKFQIVEGGTGDFLLVQGHTRDGQRHFPSLTATVRKMPNGGHNWNPYGEARIFNSTKRIHWFGRDPAYKNVLGFRGSQDVEKPVGQWNRIEAICKGDTLTCILNGQVVNKATNSSLSEGKIFFQSVCAEIFFRRIELHPLR